LLNSWLVLKIMRSSAGESLKNEAKLLLLVLLCAFCAGVILNWFSLPPVFQPIHFLLACLAFGLQFAIILRVWK
jgi:protein-S-isoprenylcysteine O-methyltransferase Ste14